MRVVWCHRETGCRGGGAQPQVPGNDHRLCLSHRQRTREVYGVRPAKHVSGGQSRRARSQCGRELDHPGRRPEVFPVAACPTFERHPKAPSSSCGCEGGVHLGEREAARQYGVGTVPHLRRHIAAGLLDQQLDECTAVEEGDQPPRRSSPTRSATGPLACTRRRPVARGRPFVDGRDTTPSRSSRSMTVAASTAISLATGTPRSVTTTSSPPRARSTQDRRFDRSSLIATSMAGLYYCSAPSCTD